MPGLNLTRADRAIRRAAELLRRPMPAGYPADPAARYRELTPGGGRAGWGVVELTAEGAELMLERAVRAEADAREAQELAVEALRWLGARSPSWARVGGLVGMTGQGAHRRFAARADAPARELTIDDELDASSNGHRGP